MNAIHRLRPSENSRAVDVASLVNDAYQAAQEQLFSEPTPRLSVASVSAVIAAGEFVVYEVDHHIVGVVLQRDTSTRVGFFGVLAVSPNRAGSGIARTLLDFIEFEALERGVETMELDLLLPDTPTPHQYRLKEWYERRGYVAGPSRDFRDVEPEAAQYLRYPTQLVRYSKNLRLTNDDTSAGIA
jgi:GNAT superfamily N-acetyltransferase